MHVTLPIDTQLSIPELAGILRNQLPSKERQELVDLLQADDEAIDKEPTKRYLRKIVNKRFEEQPLTAGIQKLSAESQAFNFLNDEGDLYSIGDLKEVYNG